MSNSLSDKRIIIAGHDSQFLVTAYNLINPLFPSAVFVSHTVSAMAELEGERPSLVMVSAKLFEPGSRADFSEFLKTVAKKNIHLIAVDSPEEILPKISSRFEIHNPASNAATAVPVEKRAGFSSLEKILNTLPFMAFVLNEERKIIFSNHKALTLLKKENETQFSSLHPGEILGCIHGQKGETNCGFQPACQFCGINQAVLQTLQSGEKTSTEASLTMNTLDGQISLNVQAEVNSLTLLGQKVLVLYLEDISDLKRRRELERIFFHDLINTAGGIKTLVDYLATDEDDIAEIKSLLQIVGNSSTQLLDEIRSQKDLSAAEHDELRANFSQIDSLEIIQKVSALYSYHQAAIEKKIEISATSCQIKFSSDAVLLNRVLGNLLKNALEAGRKGDKVEIGCTLSENQLLFFVKNNQVIPEEIKLQIFQRSFSTKGNNRGIGTYSIKLLTEKYLHGQVNFSSDSAEGTVFRIYLPL